MTTILLSVAGAAVVLALFATTALTARRRRVWREFADRYGLRVEDEPGGPLRVAGMLDGHPFELRISRSSSDGDFLGFAEERMSLYLAPDPPPPGLTLRRRGPRRLTTEDPRLARVDPDLAAVARLSGPGGAWLTPARRSALADLLRASADDAAGVERGEVYLRRRSAGAGLEELESRKARLLSAARRISAQEG